MFFKQPFVLCAESWGDNLLLMMMMMMMMMVVVVVVLVVAVAMYHLLLFFHVRPAKHHTITVTDHLVFLL